MCYIVVVTVTSFSRINIPAYMSMISDVAGLDVTKIMTCTFMKLLWSKHKFLSVFNKMIVKIYTLFILLLTPNFSIQRKTLFNDKGDTLIWINYELEFSQKRTKISQSYAPIVSTPGLPRNAAKRRKLR